MAPRTWGHRPSIGTGSGKTARFLDKVFGPRCRYGCGTRVFPRDVATHEDINHAGDTLPGPTS